MSDEELKVANDGFPEPDPDWVRELEALAEQDVEGEDDTDAELASDAEPPDPAVAQLNERVRRVAEHVRAESRAERLVDPAVFAEEPFSFTDDELAEVVRELETNERYSSIARTADERTGTEYLHDLDFLSGSYATLLLRAQANDPAYLVASFVRERIETHREPTSIAIFTESPVFGLTEEDVHRVIEEIVLDPLYADIRQVTASDGTVFLYSEQLMTEAAAQAQAEWIAVEVFQSP